VVQDRVCVLQGGVWVVQEFRDYAKTCRMSGEADRIN